jgi:serine/threonine-protein phosphatase 4 regulatory subunit 1
LLDDDTKLLFVDELKRVGNDPVHLVRQEAAYVLGALAKVVPEEVLLCSLESESTCS